MKEISKALLHISRVFSCVENVRVPKLIDIIIWHERARRMQSDEREKSFVQQFDPFKLGDWPTLIRHQLEFDGRQVEISNGRYCGVVIGH